MPRPDEAEQADIKVAPSSPSISLQLHQEFAVFRSTLLTDIKSLLQAALQEVLDQHGVLIKGQENSIKQLIEEASGHVQASNEYYYAGYEADTMPMINYDVKTQPLILDGAVPDYGAAVEAGIPPPAVPAPPPDPQHLRSRRAGHKKGEILDKQKSGEIPKSLRPKGHVPNARGSNDKMVLFGKSPRFLQDGTAMDQEPYDVSSLYKTWGVFQWIATSEKFSAFTLLMLLANMVYMGADADTEKDSVGLQAVEQLFICFFILELAFRYAAFAIRQECMRDFWFKFDLFLVAMMIFETWMVPLARLIIGADSSRTDVFSRLVRVLRLLRIVRIMRAFPELVTMVKGMLAASWAILSAFVMLASLVYIFGITIHLCLLEPRMSQKSLLDDEHGIQKYWSSLPTTIWTLIVHGIFLDDLGDVSRSLLDGNNRIAFIIFSLFVFVSAAIVMNMLIGIIIEAVRQVSAAEKENTARGKVRIRLLRLLKPLDVDGSGDITQEQLLGVVRDPEVAALLRELEVDIPHLLEVQDMFYEGDDQVLRIPQIMNSILELRGDRSTTVSDMVNGLSFSRWVNNRQLNTQLSKFKEYMDLTVERLTWQMSPQKHVRQGQPVASNQLLQSLTSMLGK